MQAVLAFSLVVSSLISNPDLLLQTGDKAPPFSMRDLDGDVVALRDITGPTATAPGKTIVLSFFATWCEPCKAELQDLRQIEKLWKTREVQMIHIGLSQGETLPILAAIQSELAHHPRFLWTSGASIRCRPATAHPCHQPRWRSGLPKAWTGSAYLKHLTPNWPWPQATKHLW